MNAARGATNPVSFISSAARERLFVHVNACRGMPVVQPVESIRHPKFGRIMRRPPGLEKAAFFIDCKIQCFQMLMLKTPNSQTISYCRA
ncbi:hypothetical protein EMIT0158MI4_90004 [Burkholderia ambifaria]